MIKKLITQREIRVFAISCVTGMTALLIGKPAFAYWTDQVSVLGTNTITSANYVPAPKAALGDGKCVAPTDKNNKFFKVTVSPPDAAIDSYKISLTYSSQLLSGGSGSAPFLTGADNGTTPTVTQAGEVTRNGSSIIPQTDNLIVKQPGIIWGFNPVQISGILTTGRQEVISGSLYLTAMIGNWESLTLQRDYRTEWDTTGAIIGAGTVALVPSMTGCNCYRYTQGVQSGSADICPQATRQLGPIASTDNADITVELTVDTLEPPDPAQQTVELESSLVELTE